MKKIQYPEPISYDEECLIDAINDIIKKLTEIEERLYKLEEKQAVWPQPIQISVDGVEKYKLPNIWCDGIQDLRSKND